MSTRVDPEDVEATRSEKVLAVVLAVFLLIGTSWFYVKVADWVGETPSYTYTAAEQRTMDRASEAQDEVYDAESRRDDARTELDLARDRLTLALDQGRATDRLDAALDRAEATYRSERGKLQEARATADAAQEEADAAQRSFDRRADGRDDRYWLVAGLRLLLVAALVGGSLRLLTVQRARGSRYLTLGFSAVAAATLTAVWFAGDYVTDYIDVVELGPIVLSVLGAAATVVAFVALQRYLARRVPRRRVRKGECPFCGFPVREEGPHCEGCGRDVVAECGSCSRPRRVGAPHCATCGAD